MLQKSKPEDAKQLWQQAQQDADTRFRLYEYMAQRKSSPAAAPAEVRPAPPVPVETGK
jgi:pyruvate-ferredoxin/flavodoxin oxidoreductase